MKSFLAISSVCLFLLLVVGHAKARPGKRYDATTQTCRILNVGQLDWDTQPWGKGAKVFKESCKSCHTRKNDKGAPFLWAESKTSRGWDKVFAEKYPQCAKEGSWSELTLDNQLILNDYLYRWSLDSQDLTDSC